MEGDEKESLFLPILTIYILKKLKKFNEKKLNLEKRSKKRIRGCEDGSLNQNNTCEGNYNYY